ncbi:MAG: transcriptional repressor [Phycisphaerales bacterium]|nr:transcriptional repressor [Phycisphaerales bacterium]
MHRLDSDQLRDFFHGHGLRRTRQRELIYASLAASRAHPTADELFRAVRADEPGLSLATVYNTLDTLVEHGLARKIATGVGNGPCRYDADLAEHAHILLDDGAVMDIPEDLSHAFEDAIPAEVADALQRRLGIEITGVQVQIAARRVAD